MSNVSIKTIAELDYYKGPHAISGIKFRTAGRDLGVTAWGMNVLELDAGCTGYPEHDHVKDGQEEVYFVVQGSADLLVDGQTLHVSAGQFIRVGPASKRKFLPGKNGLTILAVGGTPGKAYPAGQ